MATLYALTGTVWTLIATRGNPSMRMRDVDRARVHIGSVAPALGDTNYITVDNGRVPMSFGSLGGGRRMWARADGATALLEVDDTGGGSESVTRLISSLATTNATLVKSSPGRVHRLIGRNNVASARFLKLYNKTTAPTVGTDVPLLTIPLAPSANFNESLGEVGQLFDTGIGFAITGAIADNDTTAIAAADILGLNVLWA